MAWFTLTYSHISLRHGCGQYLLFVLSAIALLIYYSLDVETSDCSRLCPYQTHLTFDRLIFNSSDFVKNPAEFVCSQNFRNLADWIYGWPEGVHEEKIEATTDGKRLAPCLPPGSILHVKSDCLEKFFRLIYPHLTNKFVLITSQGDASAPSGSLSYLHAKDSKIIHWFAQNPDIYLPQSTRFTPIPIGLCCYHMTSGIRSIARQYHNQTLPSIFGGEEEPRYYTHLLDVTTRVLSGELNQRFLLLNFDPKTDPTGIRSQMWKTFCPLPFVTCIDKPSGVQIPNLPTIYTRNRQYPLWLSPRGNGLDCHRSWEALYLDAIPIVWNSTLNPLFADLPVIIINDWKELTEQYLRNQLKEIATKKMSNPSVYRWEKLRFSYWRRMILSKSRHSTTAVKRKHLCWHGKFLTNTN